MNTGRLNVVFVLTKQMVAAAPAGEISSGETQILAPRTNTNALTSSVIHHRAILMCVCAVG